MISVVCPTITGREDWLERCEAAYAERTVDAHEFIVVKDEPTCGIAWNEGLRRRHDRATRFHLTADDVEPSQGWDLVGDVWLRKGILPAPRILNTDGTTQSCGDTVDEQPTGTRTELTRIPYFPLSLLPFVYPIIETHYYTDSWVSFRARQQGWDTQVVREFLFWHHFAQVGRLDSRLYPDYDLFKQACKEAAA